MDEPWHTRVQQLFREGFGAMTSKVKVNQAHRCKDVQVGSFRMMFSSDLYPETHSGKEFQAESISEDDDEEDGERKKTRISEAGLRTEKFLLAASNLIIDHVTSTFEPTQKITNPDLSKAGQELGRGLESILQLSDEAESLEEILLDLEAILKGCVKKGHPRALNSPTSGIDVISLAGEWLTATANTNMFTYEIAPVFILIEDIILTKMRSLIGWPEACGDGIFAPGGAISNMYAIAVARHKLKPECKSEGMSRCPQLVMFVTAQCSSSLIRSGVILGLGLKNVVFVECNARGQMMASDLDAKIRKSKVEGAVPFFVSTNCGSAMLGSFDVLTEIADVCEKHDLWLHVDASHGGSVLLSKDHCHLVRGIRRAHSVTWNCHNMLGVMLQCSAILIREKGLLEACNSTCATYLFQQDKHYDMAYDTGDKAIQCGRHNDVFKLWLVWRARGHEGMAKHVERLFYLARHFTELLLSSEGFHLVLPEFEFVTVCFWFVPEVLRDGERDDVMETLSQLTQKVVEKVNTQGNCLIGCFDPSNHKMGKSQDMTTSSSKRRLKLTDLTLLSIHDLELPTFFKVIMNNPATEVRDLDQVLVEIRRTSEETVAEIIKEGVARSIVQSYVK